MLLMWEGLAPDSGGSAIHVLTDTLPSRASRIVAPPLPHFELHLFSYGLISRASRLFCARRLAWSWVMPKLV